MIPRIRLRMALVVPVTLLLALCVSSSPRVQAGDNLPVYTSAIEITGGRINIVAAVPDRNTGQMIEVPLPPGLLGPKMGKMLQTPLGVLMDDQWNNPDPKTGKIKRQEACDDPEKGAKRQVQDQVKKIGGSYSAYNISCNLATKGIVLVKQSGSVLYLSYQLLNNRLEFNATSPYTCNKEHGTPFCPNDPRFSVTFASEIWTVLRAPSICHMTSEPGTVNMHAVQIDSHNASADLARLFKPNEFMAAELAMQAAEKQQPLPVDDNLKELRDSAPCTDRNNPGYRVLAAFSALETVIDPARGIIFRITHPPIAPPRFQNVSLPYGSDTCKQGFVWRDAFPGDHVCVTPAMRRQAAADNANAASRRQPGGGAYGPDTCKQGFVWRGGNPADHVCVTPAIRSQTAADNSQASSRRALGNPQYPSFARPNITAQPVVAPGSSVQVNGQFFPATVDATVLSLSLERDTTSACNGGATELDWGKAGGQTRTDRLPPGGAGSCASRYQVTRLAPGTAYQFRARDCDLLTCSPWTPFLQFATEGGGATGIALTLDGGTPLGTATADGQGSFQANVTIPPGTPAGMHTLQARSGDANASVSIQVAAPAPSGGNARMVLTGSFFGETGCPTHPLPDYAQSITTDDTFSLFGSGFGPGTVTIFLDSPGGMALGSVGVAGDGSFCGAAFRGPPTSLLGSHTLNAVQNGAVQATIPVKVIRPDVVR